MLFNKENFDKTFDFASVGGYLPLMREFQAAEPTEENDDFVIYQAIIATQEPNNNYVIPDEQTLRNIAQECNRPTAKDDIPIYPNHDARDFQIGVMLSANYEENLRQTTGTFNICKDPETEVLRKRMELGIVRDMSPKLVGRVECNVCDERMYAYGCCVNDHWLGETIRVEGKDILVTGTFKDAHVIEVSVVSKGAFPSAVLFSETENVSLLQGAIDAGILNEKAIHTIAHNYSVDMERFTFKPPKSTSLPNKPTGGTPMAEPTQLEATPENITLLQNQVQDAKAKIAEKDKQLAAFSEEKKGLVPQAELEEVRTKLTEANQSLIEKDAQISKAADYDASVAHVQKRAIEFYAKIRGVDVDNDTDDLFVSRKKALQESSSLSYLLSALQQYQEDYYADTTQFGGQTTRTSETSQEAAPIVNAGHFDF